MLYNIIVVLPYIDMNQPWVYVCSPSWTPLPPHSPSHSSGLSRCTSPEHLSHASNLDWWSVSHMIIYMFQCYSLKSSHPRLLPQSPKDCYIHLCLFCCLAYRVIVTIFLFWHCLPVFLPGKFHGQRSLVGYSPWGLRVKHDLATKQQPSGVSIRSHKLKGSIPLPPLQMPVTASPRPPILMIYWL